MKNELPPGDVGDRDEAEEEVVSLFTLFDMLLAGDGVLRESLAGTVVLRDSNLSNCNITAVAMDSESQLNRTSCWPRSWATLSYTS